MFSFILNHQTYSCPTQWHELPISKAIDLQTLVKELPDSITKHFQSLIGPPQEIIPIANDDKPTLYEFWRKAIHALTECPIQTLDLTSDADIQAISEHCLTLFIYSLLVTPIFQPLGLTHFNADGELLWIPESGTDVMGDQIPFAEITAKEFCDASDISSTGDLRLASTLLAVLCHPKGQTYNIDTAKNRATHLNNLPMSIYLEVYTRLLAMHDYLRNEHPKLYGSSGEQNTDEIDSWADKILYVANDRPSELPCVENMNAYEFVRILNAKLKREKQQWGLITATKNL